jgi:hypothetical protein
LRASRGVAPRLPYPTSQQRLPHGVAPQAHVSHASPTALHATIVTTVLFAEREELLESKFNDMFIFLTVESKFNDMFMFLTVESKFNDIFMFLTVDTNSTIPRFEQGLEDI